MVTCGICHEEKLPEVGELDSCDHSFCFACIQHWAQIESRCPFCKARFTTISRKTLDLKQLPDSEDESDDVVRQRFPGTVLEIVQVPERNQAYLGDAEWAGDETEDPLGDVICMECGQGNDEDNLMLCDGCERACHTYCANLDSLPEGDWFCWVCMENRDRELAGEEPVNMAAQRPQRRARSSLIASDFTLPRSRRRASSPGARSELSGRSRRVRRRLVRSGDRLQPERSLSGSQRLGSDADSILNALERSISARDYAGLSTTAEHRRLAGLRGAWNSVRQGQRPFPVRSSRPSAPPAQVPTAAPQANDAENQAWAAFDASRRTQDRTARRALQTGDGPAALLQARAVTHSPEHVAPSSPVLPRPQTASSLARQAVAEARSRGRQLGPSGRCIRSLNPRRSSSSAATVASQRGRSADMQLNLASGRQAPHEGRRGLLQHRPESGRVSSGVNRHDSAEGRRMVHAIGRASLPDRSSSSMQRESLRSLHQPHTQQPRPPQPPSSPRLTPSSPRLRGAHNATDTTAGPALALQQAFSSHPCHTTSAQQHSYGRYPSSYALLDPTRGSNQQAHSSQLPAYDHAAQQPGYWPPSAPLPATTSPNEMQQPQQHVNLPVHYPQQGPALEGPPPLPALPPGVSSPNARVECDKQADATEKGDDSSDSSSSQVASQQQHNIRAMPGRLAGASDASFANQDRRAVVTRAPGAAIQLPTARAIDLQCGTPTLTKQQAADAVKAIIKPLYAAKALSKEQFKAVAQSCTHMLADPNRQIQCSVHQVVSDRLTEMGLSQAASCL